MSPPGGRSRSSWVEWSEGNHGQGRQHPESVALHIKRFVSELETPTRT